MIRRRQVRVSIDVFAFELHVHRPCHEVGLAGDHVRDHSGPDFS